MNYRHAYHAGNHTEVFKHSVLVLILEHLKKKPRPFAVLDTHAGAGKYDLTAEPARKTGEALDGIARVIDKDVPLASGYLDLIRRLNPAGLCTYPGSPAIVQEFLRENDKLMACELRDDDVERLRALFGEDRRVSVHRRDGYEAMRGLLPPPTRRGLVFADPPFEAADEFERLADALNRGIKKWPIGIFLAWYPLKDRSGTRELQARYSSDNPSTLCCEFLREPLNGSRLAGSGVIICNPPWHFEQTLRDLCDDLLVAFEAERGTYALDWWIKEDG
jgi:23S rRNA (adenine2030-N6)-methyltransferase